MRDYEGSISIDGVDFWTWVDKNYLPSTGDEIMFGQPKWNEENQCLDIEYAGSNSGSPASWVVPPKFAQKETI